MLCLEHYELDERRKKKQKLENTRNKRILKERYKEYDDEIEDAESRMIFDPVDRIFDYAKRRVTDLKENVKVSMPKPCSPKEEAELEMIRKVVMETFIDYKRAIEKNNNNKPGTKYKEKLC